ncbi:50S ribosomal protein L23 [Candidatus Peribacteria bacterium RIFCSPHIGHO2_02_FULL_53_20]|nr:MAG: 50S ribosomal protein L23 [Candidatus Peribacteria bacterium RIFCSPHIGHO2_02_FULL_53_20]OGJ67476.1 MAG: 50S ribosomal protein L23 [Candidatus Peribacteria bacterium RIFCSPLOWO2_01_FULL_53_10]OGJ70636.1 MAG: 50S ribosomal protein L23 [Candidatus Peribacteria bacterium RIFCSPLOWO2_12_FULL_53_10]
MDLSRVILGSIVTEKAERLKAERKTYSIKVAPAATKIEVKKALKEFYDIDVASVRVMRTRGKTRLLGQGKVMEKRHPIKKMMVTLASGSKALDLTAFTSR